MSGSDCNGLSETDLDPQSTAVALNLCVNGVFTFAASVALPSDQPNTPIAVQLPVSDLERHSRRYNDSYELVFTLACQGLPSPMLPLCNAYAFVRFPWGTDHYLGPIAANDERVASARLVRGVPAHVDVFVQVDNCIPPSMTSPWPCEMLLKEHIKVILENDEFCGSVSSAHMQNLVRELPFYNAAMRRLKWTDLVEYFAEFYHCWSFATYTVEEHQRLGLSDLTAAGELRLVANRFRDVYVLGDTQRDSVKLRALLEYRELVASGDVSFTAHSACSGLPVDKVCAVPIPKGKLHRLAMSRSFLTLNCINYLQMLKQAAERYNVLFSPLHPIRLDKHSPSLSLSEGFRFGPRKSTLAGSVEQSPFFSACCQ